MRICFRVDSSLEIGSGHTMRCITFALALEQRHNAKCYFITRPLAGHLNDLITSYGFDILLLPVNDTAQYGAHPNAPKHSLWLRESWELDAKLTRIYISEMNADILVVDHYALDREWENVVADNNTKIMVIDDLADRQHNANLLLDYTINRTKEHYAPLINERCNLLTGLKYVLLRDEFNFERNIPNIIHKENLEVLINMGGVDQHNFTQKVVEILRSMNSAQDLKYLIVVGMNYPFYDELCYFLERTSLNYVIFRHVNNISQLMRGADLAISALGSTAWELISQGIPCLLVATAHNQRRHLREVRKSGLAEVITDVSFDCLSKQVGNLLNNVSKRKWLSERAYAAIDAGGTDRVATELKALCDGNCSNSI